jgi:hypothetical protein
VRYSGDEAVDFGPYSWFRVSSVTLTSRRGFPNGFEDKGEKKTRSSLESINTC